VTLNCSSDDVDLLLFWYNNVCVTAHHFGYCPNDAIYTGFAAKSRPRFSVTEGVNATRDLSINSTQLTDAGVYHCAEHRLHVRGTVTMQDSSSAQLIVLGNYKIVAV